MFFKPVEGISSTCQNTAPSSICLVAVRAMPAISIGKFVLAARRPQSSVLLAMYAESLQLKHGQHGCGCRRRFGLDDVHKACLEGSCPFVAVA